MTVKVSKKLRSTKISKRKKALPEALKKFQFKKGHKPIPKGQGKPKLKLAEYSPEKKKAALDFFKKMAKKKPSKVKKAKKLVKKAVKKVKKVLTPKGQKISKALKRHSALKKKAVAAGKTYKPKKIRKDAGKAKGSLQTRALRSMNAM